MKTPRLEEKTGNRYLKGLFAFIIFFALIWGILFLTLMEPQEMDILDKICFIVPGIIILVVGMCLYIFFNRQVVSIVEYERNLLCYQYNGKQLKFRKDEIIYYEEKSSRYIFYLNSGKRLSAYKHMPPTPRVHAKKLESQIRVLVKKGILK